MVGGATPSTPLIIIESFRLEKSFKIIESNHQTMSSLLTIPDTLKSL